MFPPSPFPVRALALLAGLLVASHAHAGWRVVTRGEQREARPPADFPGATDIRPGDPWPTDNKFRWLVGDLEIPETIDRLPTAGKVVGLQLNCGDGGEVWVDGRLQCRFDNDHPALVVVGTNAVPGARVRVVAQVYAKVQGGDRFDQAHWVVVEARRALQPLVVTVDARRQLGAVPDGIIGLSQGGGMSDYDDATAAKLREGRFRWFRMDNVLTGVLRTNRESGGHRYDWADLDRRVDFIRRVGADPILCVSYMPEVLDAVHNNERQSAPRDYAVWEELCHQAAKHNLERGTRIPFWEVWNEVNTGWLKPGPEDTGSDLFRDLYTRAIGRVDTNTVTIRRFEAYCKLYRATVRGIRRADPAARIGGPALASGPMEFSPQDCGHCSHGAGFARGLILWCEREHLPLDFVSWHEYFQSPGTLVREAAVFRDYLAPFPDLRRGVTSFMLTEWNEAWWADRPHDHEVGAAWCANTVTRAFLPAGIDRPCFFYVKQGDMNFRGDYSMLMGGNVPKASYNMARVFNGLSGRWLPVGGAAGAAVVGNAVDDDVSAVAAWDGRRRRLAVVLVNFRDRHSVARPVRLSIPSLPGALRNGRWQQSSIDATHANVWDDPRNAELSVDQSGVVAGRAFEWAGTLAPNSVTLLEVLAR